MKSKFLKCVTCACVLSILAIPTTTGIMSVKAAPAGNQIVQANDNKTIQIKNFKSLGDKINKSMTVEKDKIVFDEAKALKSGLSKSQVQNLKATYDSLNKMIEDKTVIIVKQSNGKYDIQANNATKPINDTAPRMQQNVVVNPNIYGYDIFISASECNDIAAELAGGTATVAMIGGLLGLDGQLPAAAALTVAAGVLGIGSAYMWYASNHGGLDASLVVYTAQFYYHVHNQ
ncbi:MAG: hypothetical protein F8N39_15240 [Clostridiaceae bacterium]|nr:hypothetical protein [Clostridiaceae bacterium]